MDKKGLFIRFLQLLLVLAVLGAWGVGLVMGPTFTVLIVTLVFLGAFLLVPLLGFLLKASTPRFIAEPLASLIVSVSLGGLGRAVMEFEDGRYEKRLLEEDESYPTGAYYTVGLGELAIVYDRSNGDLEAWSATPDIDTLSELDASEVAPDKVNAETTRNGMAEFIDTALDPGSVFVYAAEILSQWRDSASIEDAHIGENKARHEQNIEASSSDRTLGDRIEWFVLFATGIAIGWIFFF